METASTRIWLIWLYLYYCCHMETLIPREDSQFKQLLERHSNNIQEDTLESIRIVKDFLVQSGDLESIEVTTHMIDTCKGSYSLYKKYLKGKKQESNCQKAKEEGRIEQFSY